MGELFEWKEGRRRPMHVLGGKERKGKSVSLRTEYQNIGDILTGLDAVCSVVDRVIRG